MELVLNTYGGKISIDNNAFIVTNNSGRQRIPCTDVTSITIAKSTVLTSDALMLAVDCDIPVRFTDRGGNNVGCVWSQSVFSKLSKMEFHHLASSCFFAYMALGCGAQTSDAV